MLLGFDRISATPGIRSGQARIEGTRITVADILGWLSIGMSFEEIIHDFDELSEEDIKQALQFAAKREESVQLIAA